MNVFTLTRQHDVIKEVTMSDGRVLQELDYVDHANVMTTKTPADIMEFLRDRAEEDMWYLYYITVWDGDPDDWCSDRVATYNCEDETDEFEAEWVVNHED